MSVLSSWGLVALMIAGICVVVSFVVTAMEMETSTMHKLPGDRVVNL